MPKPSAASPQHNSIWITLEDFEFMCFDIARKLLAFNEPIPDYKTRNNALLESALASPRQTFDKKLLYPSFPQQASILFYSLIKNHPFQNGNKRIAVMALLVFLSINDKWITIKPELLYKIAIAVSKSKSTEKNDVISSIVNILNESLVESKRKE